MKRLAVMLCLVFCLLANFLQAQSNITNDYVIISTANVTEIDSYTDALDVANWESFRLQNQRYKLIFDNGFTIEIKSAVELLNAGHPLNLSNYAITLPVGYVPTTLTLLGGNLIGMAVNSPPSKSY